jgi:hypothetical protein
MNKKAISEIVGYTILIVIAVSLSILVYSFLRLYIPKSQVTCEEDVKLIIQGYTCEGGRLNLTLTNKGLFKAGAFYLRFEDKVTGFKNQTNPNDFLLYGPNNAQNLNPGESYRTNIYTLSNYGFNINPNGNYSLELQPAILIDKKVVVCENAIVTYDPIKCTP